MLTMIDDGVYSAAAAERELLWFFALPRAREMPERIAKGGEVGWKKVNWV